MRTSDVLHLWLVEILGGKRLVGKANLVPKRDWAKACCQQCDKERIHSRGPWRWGGFSMANGFFHGRSSEAYRASDGLGDMYGGSKLSERALGLR
jgi:hypothetical protein